MNKRQASAVSRAARAILALEKVGITVITDQGGTIYAAPTKKVLSGESSTNAVVQDHGEVIGGLYFHSGIL